MSEEIKRKKRVLFHSNMIGAATGFGKAIKEIMLYLYKTNKYELFLFGSGTSWDNPDFARYPFTIHGTIPNNPQEWQQLCQDPNLGRAANYGSYYIDRMISECCPDIYFMVEDYWGGSYTVDKPWFSKINSIFYWTADSNPILEEAVANAHKIKNHYVWAGFAEKEFKRLANQLEEVIKKQEQQLLSLSQEIQKANEVNFQNWKKGIEDKIAGYNRVKTIKGVVNTDVYRKLDKNTKNQLRQKHGIPLDAFCIGFLSRNQLRKLLPNLIEGFKIFKQNNPKVNAKLLLYTHFSEGWNVQNLMRDYNVNQEDVLCCYKCRKTGQYFVRPFQGQDIDNPVTGDKKTLITVNVSDSLPTEQVCEWYNLNDCFALPFTSGGSELTVFEAKLCELITIVTNYSCGTDLCVPEAYSLPLEHAEYREIGSQFIKASPYPSSIAKQIQKVFEMSPEKRSDWGKKARDWVLKNNSIEVIGPQIEKILDELPLIEDYDFNFEPKPKNPDAVIPEEPDNEKWIISLYKLILDMTVDNKDSGFCHWDSQLKAGMSRKEIENFFRSVATQENQKITSTQKTQLKDLLDDTGNKRLILVLKESIGDIYMSTALLKSLKENYPNHDIYYATSPQYFEILAGNPYIHKTIPYCNEFESEVFCIGQWMTKGLFDVYINLGILTQRQLSYLSNSNVILPE